MIVRLPHNKSQVYSILGILMVGAIYVPVDVNIGEKRLESILEQCNCKVVLTNGSSSNRIHEIFVNIDDVICKSDLIDKFEIEHISSDDIAYIIFTSGTTGIPKGVVISHSAAFNTIYDINQKFGVFEQYTTKNLSEGRFAVTGDPNDKMMFKVPTLRNIELTYPYFHDGQVDLLEEAVQIMGKIQLNKEFTDDELSDMVAFLKTLTGEQPKIELPHLPPSNPNTPQPNPFGEK